jgi:DNA polymerase V
MKVSFLSPFVQQLRKEIPLMLEAVQAGFPSPADDYVKNPIDINDLFQVDEASSYFVRVEGLSMIYSGIMPDDVLCVRKDIEPIHGDIVIACIDSEFTVKRFVKKGKQVVFEAANEDFPDIVPGEMQDVKVWGVVTGLARVLKRRM